MPLWKDVSIVLGLNERVPTGRLASHLPWSNGPLGEIASEVENFWEEQRDRQSLGLHR